MSDPQFWAATVIFAGAMWWLLRGVVGGMLGKKRTRGKGVKLTVKGRPPR